MSSAAGITGKYAWRRAGRRYETITVLKCGISVVRVLLHSPLLNRNFMYMLPRAWQEAWTRTGTSPARYQVGGSRPTCDTLTSRRHRLTT